jgi:hypothetical protein
MRNSCLFPKSFLLVHAGQKEALCHTHRTTCHKYMTCVRMLFAALACISGEKQGKSEGSVDAMI